MRAWLLSRRAMNLITASLDFRALRGRDMGAIGLPLAIGGGGPVAFERLIPPAPPLSPSTLGLLRPFDCR